MAAAASDGPSPGASPRRLLASALGVGLTIEPAAGHSCVGGTHSRVADGRIVCWSPSPSGPEQYAVDAELAAQPVPPHLERRWRGRWGSHAAFWDAWCATEVCAKLLDIPVVVMASRGPVGASPVSRDGQTVTYAVERRGDLVVAFGVLTSR